MPVARVGERLLGMAMLIGGGFLVLDHVVIPGHFWAQLGSRPSAYGLVLVPLGVGLALLGFDARSVPGWFLTAGAVLTLLAGIVVRVSMHRHALFRPMTLVIALLLVGGVGVLSRSLRLDG